MDNRRPTAFVSYSWDGEEHEKWVHSLVNCLRSDGSGVEATFDKFELFDKTVNLNQMMVNALRKNDYVIVVLTENYRNRADNFQGGVGFEVELLLSDLRRDRDKLIFIMRHNGDFESVFPSFLRDYYAIDFSDDKQFDKKFEELVHRIYRHNAYEKAPLGTMPNFLNVKLQQSIDNETQKVSKMETNIFKNFPVLEILKSFTDLDKEEFLRESYDELKSLFTQWFEHVKTQTAEFTYKLDEENKQKHIYKLYIQGKLKSSLKMVMGEFMYTSSTIGFSYNTNPTMFNDNSYNEIISVETINNELVLKMLFASTHNNDVVKPADIVKRVWEEQLLPNLRN